MPWYEFAEGGGKNFFPYNLQSCLDGHCRGALGVGPLGRGLRGSHGALGSATLYRGSVDCAR